MILTSGKTSWSIQDNAECVDGMHLGLFKYMQKGCKNQIVMAGRLLTVLDMRPSTMSNTTSNEAALLTAPSTTTLVQGPYLFPNYQNEDHKQAQTPVDTTAGLLQMHSL